MSDKNEMGYIAIDSIEVPELKLRDVKAKDKDFEELCLSVKKSGVLQPIQVRPYFNAPEIGEDGTPSEPLAVPNKYWVTNGLQRLSAARAAGLTEIPAICSEDSDDSALRKMVVSNQVGVKTTKSEMCKALLYLIANNPLDTIPKLASEMGMSTDTCKNILSLDKLKQVDEKLLQEVDDGIIPISNAYALSKLPLDQIPDYLDRARTEDSTTFLAAMTEQRKANSQANRQGSAEGIVAFKVTARCQTWATIQNEYTHFNKIENAKQAESALESILPKDFGIELNDENSMIVAAVLQWAASMHPSEVSRKTEEQEAKVKAREEKKARAKAEREAKKAAEAAEEKPVSITDF